MKSWKKLLALLMALAMVFALVACDSKDDDKDEDEDDDKSSSKDKDDDKDEDDEIVGEWAIELNIKDYMNSMMSEKFQGISGCDCDLPMTYSMEFKSNGKLTLAMQVEDDDLDDYLDAFCDVIVDYVIDYAAANGMGESQFRSQFEAQYGMSIENYYADQLETSKSTMLSNLNSSSTGYYKVEDGSIYTDKDEENLEDVEDAKTELEYSIKGETLTIKSISGDDEMPDIMSRLGLELPWKLKKQ